MKSISKKKKIRKRKTGRTFTIKDPIYLTEHMICCGIGEELAQKKWQKKFKLKGEIVPNNDSGGRTFFKDKYGTCLVHFSERVPGGGVVCHEAIHVAAHVLRRAGVDIGEEAAEEALAYYVSWVVREIGRIVWWKRQ